MKIFVRLDCCIYAVQYNLCKGYVEKIFVIV